MIERPITLRLHGHPAPKGSLRCIGARGKVKHQLIEDERVGQKQWRAAITKLAGEAVQRADQYQALGVDVTFTLARPADHYGSGCNAGRLNSRAPMWPTKQNTGDTDKLLRLVSDALQDSGLIVDDSQVVEVVGRKFYPVATPEALSGPHPPPWAATYRPPADALQRPGAVILIYPYEQE